jgi:two-component system NtrC family sensor kinase
MRKYFFVFLFLAFCKCTLAQHSHADSLIAKLNALPGNETRFQLLEQLSADPIDFNIKQKYVNEGIVLSIKLNKPKEEEKFIALTSAAESEIADYPAELATSSRGLQLSERLDDNRFTSIFLSSIGVAYGLQGDNQRSTNYLLKALQVATAAKDTGMMLRVASNLESTYAALKKPDSARFFAGIEYWLTNHSKNEKIRAQIGGVLGDLGEVQSLLNHPDSALQYYYRSLPYLRITNDIQLTIYIDNLIARAYLKTGRPDSAKKYAVNAYQIAGRMKKYDWLADAANTLADLYEGKNDAKSLFYYKAAVTARDSATGVGKTKRFQAVVYSEQQRQADLAYAANEYQNKIRFFAAIAGLVLVAIIGLILWIVNKKQRKGNLLLAQQKQQVEITLATLKLTQQQLVQSEKMASLGELTAGIAHEIQNPLNFVNNFSEVNKEMLEELKAESEKPKATRNEQLEIELINDLISNEEKINHHGKRADAIVKGMLQHSRVGIGQKTLTDLNALTDEFFKLSYHGLRAKDKNFNAELITHLDTQLPKIKVAQQDIGRVLLNLFNNAFYAVNEKRKTTDATYKPTVEITTFASSLSSGGWGVRVRDNGNGIPDAIKDKIMQPFFTTKPTGEGTGLGLSLSYDMVVKGHGGTITVHTKEGEFTEFTILLPN